MKAGRYVMNIIRWHNIRKIRKRRKSYPSHDFKEYINIPFIDDKNINHTYDIYLANKENRKHILVLDIHGGSYIFGEHIDNYPLAYQLLKEGFDVGLMDYLPNDGKHSIKDLFNDVVTCFNHIINHLQDYDLQDDDIYLLGNSAGAHFALLLSEAINNKEVADKLNINLPNIKLRGCLLNCPVYNFSGCTDMAIINSRGGKRMFGPTYKDQKLFDLYSPTTYIDTFDLPLFVSSCKNDFLVSESLLLKKHKEKSDTFEFIYINTDKKEVSHVHNVTYPKLEESIIVNNKMMEFMEKYQKNDK